MKCSILIDLLPIKIKQLLRGTTPGTTAAAGHISGLAADGDCNNEAELLALGKALEMVRDSGARRLIVRGDSDFAVRHLRGEAHTRVAHLHELILQMQPLLAGFASVRLDWIPRHRNPDADRLSRAALGLPDKPAAKPGLLKKKRRR